MNALIDASLDDLSCDFSTGFHGDGHNYRDNCAWRRRLVIHESGHCVADHVLGLGVDRVEVFDKGWIGDMYVPWHGAATAMVSKWEPLQRRAGRGDLDATLRLGITYVAGMAAERRLTYELGEGHSVYCAEDKLFGDVICIDRLEEDCGYEIRENVWSAAQQMMQDSTVWRGVVALANELERRLLNPRFGGVVILSGRRVRKIMKRAGVAVGCRVPTTPELGGIIVRPEPCPFDDGPFLGTPDSVDWTHGPRQNMNIGGMPCPDPFYTLLTSESENPWAR
ncbi:hypothetical protein [Methylocella sp.]|jgi:hypothetical protein|uniref:hypothetical protein n=1 Tax=Methylocella sp. TaxID=1978226 RepID=UPI003C19C6DA